MPKPRAPRTSSRKNESVANAGMAAAPAVALDTKKNVVPINLEDEIRLRAYELYQERAGAPGTEKEDWLRAEREVLARYLQTA